MTSGRPERVDLFDQISHAMLVGAATPDERAVLLGALGDRPDAVTLDALSDDARELVERLEARR